MIKGIYTSGGGMEPQMLRLEIISNNLANASTTGFKRDNMFIDLLKQRGVEMAKGKGELNGLDAKQFVDFSDGTLEQTNNELNIAITGNGFFTVQAPEGVRYTRDGNFMLSADGTITTQQGYPVLGAGGKLVIPDVDKLTQGKISISDTGEISVDNKLMGKFNVVTFDDLTALKKDGASLFSADGTTVQQSPGLGTSTILHQGFLEESNVNSLEEMIAMIELNRGFESNQKAIQAQDTTLGQATDVGRL